MCYNVDMEATELRYKVTEPIEPSDNLTIEGQTVHKTHPGEDAHIIAGQLMDEGDYLTVTLGFDNLIPAIFSY